MVDNNRFIRERKERRERKGSAVTLGRYLLFEIYAQVWKRTLERSHTSHCKQSDKADALDQKDKFYGAALLQIGGIVCQNWLWSTSYQSA